MKPSPLISWSILGLGLSMCGVLIFGQVQSFQEREEALSQTQRVLGGAKRAASRESARALELDVLKGELSDTPRWPGETPELAFLSMQENVRTILSGSQLRVTRAGRANSKDESSLGLAISAEGGMEEVQLGLFVIERHSPPITIDELRIRNHEDRLLKIDMKLTSPYAAQGIY